MVLGGKEWLDCEIHVDGARLEQVSEFKYQRCVLNESGTDDAKCRRMGKSGREKKGYFSLHLFSLILYFLSSFIIPPLLAWSGLTPRWRD